MKTCFKCNEAKNLEQFHKHSGMKDGRLNKCAACVLSAVSEWRLKNPECRKKEHAKNRVKQGIRTREQFVLEIRSTAIGKKASALNYYHRNKDKYAAWVSKDRELNPKKYSDKGRKYREKRQETALHLYLATKSKNQNKRHAAKLQRTTSWADDFVISGLYELCAIFRRTGLDMTVDHVIPLQGKLVCGLHTHDNLQLMTRAMNSSKGNRY